MNMGGAHALEITGITWSSWGPYSAQGIGPETTSNCNPDPLRLRLRPRCVAVLAPSWAPCPSLPKRWPHPRPRSGTRRSDLLLERLGGKPSPSHGSGHHRSRQAHGLPRIAGARVVNGWGAPAPRAPGKTSFVRHKTRPYARGWRGQRVTKRESDPATAAATVCMAEIDGNLSLQTSRLAVNIGA
jgi:hypothetical protein